MLVREPEKRISLSEISNHAWLRCQEDDERHEMSDFNESDDQENHNSNNNNNRGLKKETFSDNQLLTMIPLIKRENLSESDSEHIIECMVNGVIASRGDIVR